MEIFVVFLVFVGIGAFVAGIIALGRHLERKRTEAVHGWALQNGFTLDSDWNGFHATLQQFKVFNQGHSRNLRNLVRAKRGDDQVAICDYDYSTGSGKNKHVYQYTLCVVHSPRGALPHFFARPQMALFDFLGKLFGGQDINFDEDPEFSKAYVVQTSSAEYALRGLFNERTRSAFTRLAAKGVQVEGVGAIMVFHYGCQLNVERLPELVDDTLALRQVLR
jgi:hypothetical protein